MTILSVHNYTAFVQCQSLKQNSVRVLIAPNTEIAQQLFGFHTGRGADVVQVYECILQEENTWLPMPDKVFGRIEERIRLQNSTGHESIVVGLDAYLTLLDDQHVQTAFAKLHQIVDRDDLCSIFIVTSTWANVISKIFENPKYESGRKVILFAGESDNMMIPNIVLVEEKWAKVKPPIRENFRDYLQHISNFSTLDGNPLTIALPLRSQVLAGLNPAVKQVVTFADFMRCFYFVDDELPEIVLQWIFSQVQNQNCSNGLEAVRKSFGMDSDLLRSVLKRFAACSDDAEGTAWLWMLRKTVKQDSYLQRVLSLPNLSFENFLQCYVIEAALACMGDRNAETWAIERRVALREMVVPFESHIIRLIAESTKKQTQEVAVWLNNDTLYEHAELVRRCATANPANKVPGVVLQVYPLLADYIAEYSYGTPEMDEYFRYYRKLKLSNTVTPEFCEWAFNATVPKAVQSRDAIIQPYSTDNRSALLVVDGMGAEYLPVLFAQAKKHQISITRQAVATCCLPTSTEFNLFDWPTERRLQDIKRIDDVAHEGAKKHETNTYAENLATVLDEMIAKRIFERVADGLTRFEQVVVTSDHGASRLALVAYENKLTKTLSNPSDKAVVDWRYTVAPKCKVCPEEMEDTLDGEYWVIRGYNRLPKTGGKKNEMHGGATLEERLVPVVVFTKGASLDLQIDHPITPVEQLVEKDDFDL